MGLSHPSIDTRNIALSLSFRFSLRTRPNVLVPLVDGSWAATTDCTASICTSTVIFFILRAHLSDADHCVFTCAQEEEVRASLDLLCSCEQVRDRHLGFEEQSLEDGWSSEFCGLCT